MKLFDFNVHPRFQANRPLDNVDRAILDELTCNPEQLIQAFETAISTDKAWKNYEGVNYMIFTNYFHRYPEDTKTFCG